jgi:hypothetical protein
MTQRNEDNLLPIPLKWKFDPVLDILKLPSNASINQLLVRESEIRLEQEDPDGYNINFKVARLREIIRELREEYKIFKPNQVNYHNKFSPKENN